MPHYTVIKIRWLMLFKEVITVYTENHIKHINKLCGQNAAGGIQNYHWALKY
jgi:hypothetical protein